MALRSSSQDPETFASLKAILTPFAQHLSVKEDTPASYYLETKTKSYRGKPMFFAAVMSKSYVSFHLMPVYWKPELLVNLSADLRAKMQGKSCFRFRRVDPALFAELAALTRAGFEQYREARFL